MHTNHKTFDDILAAAGITAEQFAEKTSGMDADTIAYEQIKLIAKVLNEGWVADYSNDDQRKYYPWFYYQSGSGLSFFAFGYADSIARVASRLCFKSRELAEYAGKTFLEIYKVYLL